MKNIDTSSVSLDQVKDDLANMFGGNIDETDMTGISNSNWVEYKNNELMHNQVYTHQIPKMIKFAALNPEMWNTSLLFLGPTAIGKTEAIRQGLDEAAEEMGRHLNLTELHVSQMGPVDALGVPRERNGRTYWAPLEKWPLSTALEGHDEQVTRYIDHYHETGERDYTMLPKEWYVHFHDEVTNPSSPQIPHQLFTSWIGDSTSRMIGSNRLVRDYMVILAGNRVADGTNSIPLAASATTRLGIIEVVPHFGGWLQNYAFQTKRIGGENVSRIHPIVIAYLQRFNAKFAPQDLNKRSAMDPFPTPRNWTFVSDILYTNERNPLDEDLLKAAIAARVGSACCQEFFSFIAHYKDIPNVDRVLRGEEVHNWPRKDRTDLLMILGTQMVVKVDEKTAPVFVKLMTDDKKFSNEVAIATMRQLRPAGKLADVIYKWAPKEFLEFTQKYGSLMLHA